MPRITKYLLLVISLLFLLLIPGAASNLTLCQGQIPAHRDVCIIGGGAAGTYTAIQLHDFGLSVILIEKEDVLGGQTNTFMDPTTGHTVDYGVSQFQDIPEMREFLDRLHVDYDKHQPSGESLIYFNFRTGERVPDYRPHIAEAFAAYRERVSKYPQLDYGFPLTDSIPDELLDPFGQTVAAYNLSGILSRTWFGQGDILSHPTLYAYKSFGIGVLTSIRTGFLFTTKHNNYEIYEKAQQVLGPAVLLQSTVAGMDRSRNDLCVYGPPPSFTRRFHCGRFVAAIPPMIDNLNGFDLSTEERSLFSQFTSVGYYTSLVRIPGLSKSSNFSAFENIDPEQEYDLPLLPGLYRIFPTIIPDLHIVEFGAPLSISDQQVQISILADIRLLRHAGYIDSDAKAPEIVEYKSHTPYLFQVSEEAIRDGFYRRLNGLRGQLNTYYTGAAFHAQDTALLVRFTKELVNDIYVSLAAEKQLGSRGG